MKEHLTEDGFHSILKLYASINRGVSKKVSQFYPNIIPHDKIKIILPVSLNPY
jgi:hypothetical protein